MKKKALHTIRRPTFSLLEIMVVLVIMGIVLSFAVPSYQGSIERSKGRVANFTLVTIYNAEKRFRLNNNIAAYYTCDPGCTNQLIKQNLDVNVGDEHFNYIIQVDGDGFRAIATRNSGACANNRLTITNIRGIVNNPDNCRFW